MKLNILFFIVVLTVPLKQFAQTTLSRSFSVLKGQVVRMHFDYPELIEVTTWDGNEIVMQGTVSINGGENDDAFVLENTLSGNTININGHIKDIKHLPQRVTIIRKGQKIIFRDKAAFGKYQEEHGKDYTQMSFGPEIEIVLQIKVPRNIETRVESVYGMVEVKDFNGPLKVEATYGGVDAAIAERSVGLITAETNYGNIYTNLDIKFGGENTSKDFHTFVSAKPGTGPAYNFESKYGNVYMRKAR